MKNYKWKLLVTTVEYQIIADLFYKASQEYTNVIKLLNDTQKTLFIAREKKINVEEANNNVKMALKLYESIQFTLYKIKEEEKKAKKDMKAAKQDVIKTYIKIIKRRK